jgi:hypothetical protein
MRSGISPPNNVGELYQLLEGTMTFVVKGGVLLGTKHNSKHRDNSAIAGGDIPKIHAGSKKASP